MTDNVKAAEAAPRVPKRVAAVIINSLKGGVVPRIGLPYITVGREAEIRALLTDLSLIADGGASFRFLVGRYGSGKSFLLQTIRTHAMGEGFVVADADLSPERRLQGGQGQGLATYRELMRNLSTKTRPEGGALMLILDRWISNLQMQVAGELGAGAAAPGGATATGGAPVSNGTADTGGAPNDPALNQAVEARIREQVASLEEMVHGFDFARLLTLYYRAVVDGNDELKGNVARWFRGEYRTKTEARQELGVSIIIGDDDWYDYVKLFAQFLKGAGYQGMLVLIDELVNLYKIPNSVTRQYNYEKILTMYNDTLQGKAHHLGIIMGGTPQSIEDRKRGVFSYEALRSRLTQGRFAAEGMRDMLAPIIHLHPLTYEELIVLIEKLQQIHAGYFGYEARLNESDLVQFLQIEFGRVGADTHLTPREVIRDFIELLDIAYQNPSTPVASILSGVGGNGGGGEGEGGGAQQSSLSVTAAAGQRDASEFAEFKI
ncbi:ATP-binding protein [Enorma massiliensis]|uniref:ATP-binding protein n=1 Tax=Enorma massiliensis TaxID=1472761 RepID=UPI00195D8BB5|nr:ATP-binding protein [Enorma massiliensis]MBM6783051.1 ATP-binding protein [Enorma massiliensis]